ncbi:aldehyde dehydrogenase family protein [Paenibacillus sp.]|uniref:aldehyde dehydrogenase family protein n=1 Tax=Paenibacillus sp. TaxID=58172 RepID=UPI002D2C4707|nr:aldehyde dehydrogenase family protein [Paenibacillus sp.]HZG55646.1 aldehyde dehydrogenase family protein [Paenibacillus sp.]
MIEVQHYINGNWVTTREGAVVRSFNPSNLTDPVGQFVPATEQEAISAIEAAERAMPAWRAMSGPLRADYLHRAANVVEQHAEELAQTASREMGKPINESRGEMKRAVTLLRYYAGEGFRALGDVYSATDNRSMLYTNRVPLGVVSVISPWNFPVAIPIWKMAPALIFGNTVVWKPAESSTVTAFRLMQLLELAGFPPGVVNMVAGKGSVVGKVLVGHPSIKAVTFTGSNEAGRIVATNALENGKKYQLELGGKNPSIVTSDADIEHAAASIASASMRSAGQKCTATSRVIVEESVSECFTEALIAHIRKLQVSDALEEACDIGPVVNRMQQTSILQAIDRGAAEGARLLIGGHAPGGALKEGSFVEPTVFDRVAPHSAMGQQEIFGPVISLMTCKDLRQALDIANDIPFGLSAGIFTKDIDRMLYFLKGIDAGHIKINGETAGVEPHAPFGGMKQSSSHSREQGRAAIEFFTSIQTISVSPSAPRD